MEQQPQSLRDIVRTHYLVHRETATTVEAVLLALPRVLSAAIVQEAVANEVRSVVAAYQAEDRKRIRQAAFSQGAAVGLSRSRVAPGCNEATAARAILDTYILGGRRLGDWTGPDLTGYCAGQRKAMDAHGLTLTWLETLATRASDGRVRDAVTHRQAVDLLTEALRQPQPR